MAQKELRKLNRKELLQMLVEFSEETEAIREHEKNLEEQFERERNQLIAQMAEEREKLLAGFDEEKADMRAQFAIRQEEAKAKFEKDISGQRERYEREIEELNKQHEQEFEGFRMRLEREKQQIRAEVDEKLAKIEDAGNLAEAVLSVNGVMDAARKAAEQYLQAVRAGEDHAGPGYDD